MFISDVLTKEIERWEAGSEVMIQAPTGSGKTTFILEKLLPFALKNEREILYLSNRKILHAQLIKALCSMYSIPFDYMKDEKIAEFRGITVMTYQTLQELIRGKWDASPIRFFYYIVCDEIHYITEDSAFNPKIPRFLNWLKIVRREVLIAISATIEPALPYLGIFEGGILREWEEDYGTVYLCGAKSNLDKVQGKINFVFIYSIPGEKQQYNIKIYANVEELVDVINGDEGDKKWLIFQANKERANEIKRKLNKPSVLVTADDKKSKSVKEIIENNKFSEKILLATKVIDNGVNICDPQLENIVLDTISKTEFLQMLGRRRKQSQDEVIDLYLPKLSSNYFNSVLIRSIYPEMELIEKSEYILRERIFCFPEEYKICRRYFDMEEGRLILNPIVKDSLKRKKDFCEKMKRKLEYDEFAFVKEQLKWLDLEDEFSEIQVLPQNRKNKANIELDILLKSLKDKEIDKEHQEEFRKTMTEVLLLLLPEDKRRKDRAFGLKVLNQLLEKLQRKERIISISGKQEGEKTRWKIVEK